MRRDPPWREDDAGKVLHVVGHLTDGVFGFLGPATHAIAGSGRAQAVVVIDELRSRPHLAGLHEAAELVLVPRVSGWRQWRALLQACRLVLAGEPVRALHLHGLLPALVGAWAVRITGLPVQIVYSPDGPRAPGTTRAIRTLAVMIARPLLHPARRAAAIEKASTFFMSDTWEATEVAEKPVHRAFFKTPRREARHPLVVTDGGGQGVRGVERFAQLAVLLSGEDLRISFNWIGAVDPVSRLRLTAANVGVFDVSGEADCAARLAGGWIYLAPGATRDFPLGLVQAMAAGLPCVALDCAEHRSVLREGETGFLCESERDMIERIAMLIDDPALRTRVGAAARDEIKPRFGESEFGARLLAAYALPK